MTPRLRYLLLAVAASLLVLGVVGCGGGGGDNEDPRKVLDETFQSGSDYSRGVAELSFKLAAEGGQSGSLDATVKGPFRVEAGAFPQFDLSADVNLEGSGQSVGFQGRLISTADAAYVNFQGTDYRLDAPTFGDFKQLFLALQSQISQEQPGALDPAGFLADLSNEGTEDVGGTEAIHISGEVDVDKLVDRLKTSVKSADFDVFTGADDKRLRKIDANIVFEPPASRTGGASEKITIQFSLAFTELGQPQVISAPAKARPLSTLLQKYGLDAGGLGRALGAAAAASASGSSAGGTGATSGTAPAPPADGQANQYLQCLSQAKGQAATQACSALLE